MSHATAINTRSGGLVLNWLLVLCTLMFFILTGPALAKRTNGGLVGGIVPTPVLPPITVPAQFDITGYIQEATLDTSFTLCPKLPTKDPRLAGGTVKINGQTIVVPCNTILQMPAYALTWADLFTMAPKDITPTGSGLALNDLLGGTAGAKVVGLLNTPSTLVPLGYNAALPGHEFHVQGNVMPDGQFIAGLIFISQQSLNSGQGVISCINYPTGEMQLNGPALTATYATDGKCALPTATTTRVRMNDPIGRYGWDHGGPGSAASVIEPGYDPRYTADTDNPTMHSALGFPICIPAFGPAPAASDPLCPMYNRPIANVGGLCPSFPAGSLLPAFGATIPGDYCRTWVMDLVGAHAANPSKTDPTLSAPLVIGDTITFAGTLKSDATGPYISAHTIGANLGIYTQPHSKPSYVFMEGVLVGTGGAGIGGLAVESTNKVSWTGFASDVTELVDFYAVHQNPADGSPAEYYLGTWDPCCTPLGRFRTPANNLGSFGEPQRNYRAISRNACQPDTTIANVNPNTGLVKDPAPGGVDLTQLQTLCHMDPLSFVPTSQVGTGAGPMAGVSAAGYVSVPNVTTGMNNIKTAAGLMLNQNGLVPAQYTLPNFEFIFAENLNFGTPLVSNNFQDLPFAFCGSGPIGGPGSGTTVVGQLDPAPWALPMPDPAFHLSLCPLAAAVGAASATPVATSPQPPSVTVSPLAAAATVGTVPNPAITLTVTASNLNGTAPTIQWGLVPAGTTLTPQVPLAGTNNGTTTTWTAKVGFGIGGAGAPATAGTFTFGGNVFNTAGGTPFAFPVAVTVVKASAPTINSVNSALAGRNAGSFIGGQTVQIIATATPNIAGHALKFSFAQTSGQTPAVTLSAVGPAPAGYCKAPQLCQMVTFTAPFNPASKQLTFNVTVTETATGLSATKTSGTVIIAATPPDVIAITSAAWIGERNIAGTPLNVGKFHLVAISSATPAPIGMTMTAWISNSTLAGMAGSTASPMPLQLTLQPADATAPTPVCGATPCWTGVQLGVIDNQAGSNLAPLRIDVTSNLGGTATMLMGDPLYVTKCIVPAQSGLTATFNPATGLCLVQ